MTEKTTIGSECIGCGLSFTGVSSFDAHRVGPHGYCATCNPNALEPAPVCQKGSQHRWFGSPLRRCLTPSDMTAAGWRQDDAGLWTPFEAMSDEAKARRRKGATA